MLPAALRLQYVPSLAPHSQISTLSLSTAETGAAVKSDFATLHQSPGLCNLKGLDYAKDRPPHEVFGLFAGASGGCDSDLYIMVATRTKLVFRIRFNVSDERFRGLAHASNHILDPVARPSMVAAISFRISLGTYTLSTPLPQSKRPAHSLQPSSPAQRAGYFALHQFYSTSLMSNALLYYHQQQEYSSDTCNDATHHQWHAGLRCGTPTRNTDQT